MSDDRSDSGPPLARRHVLAYRTPDAPTSAITVRSCFDPCEAQLSAAVLAASGIECYVLNENTRALGPYLGLTQIEVQVRREDAHAARELLAQFRSIDDLEPAQPDPGGPVEGLEGEGVLAPAAAYDNPQSLYHAAATLGAARIECYLPDLLPRGDRPPGHGKRFILRVPEDDLTLARQLLEADAAEADDEPRCPRCGSWRVHRAPRPWPGLIKFLLGASSPEPRQMECLRCKHRWTSGDFHGEGAKTRR